MNGSENVSYIVAFTFGMLTFLSPCLLPLIPSFIAYITGVSFSDLKDAGKKGEVRKKAAAHSLLFILGFSVVFIALGLTATLIGKTLFEYQKAIRIIGGALIILFGLNLAGILRLDFLGKEFKLRLPVKSATYLGSFLVGVTFAAAWTPCAGPILGSILAIAGTQTDFGRGAALLTVYSAGIGLPFFVTGLLVNSFLQNFNRFKNIIARVNVVSGILLIIVGMLVMTNYLTVAGEKLMRLFGQ
jgi:cytochrome c-type biogenesis protein